jgi:hypothetical protein
VTATQRNANPEATMPAVKGFGNKATLGGLSLDRNEVMNEALAKLLGNEGRHGPIKLCGGGFLYRIHCSFGFCEFPANSSMFWARL